MSIIPINWIFAYPVPIQVAYLVASFVIGVAGINRKMGFWGHFFCSLIFSPVIGLMMILVSAKKTQNKKEAP